MDKENFGHLVATLRKESRNEFDEPLTQYDLAELARIPLITLQKIEQGRQANIKPEMLLNLSEALHLNSRATQFFFLASLGIKDVQTIRPIASPQHVLEELTQILSQLQTPAFVLDGFSDIVVMNNSSLTVFTLEISQLHAPHLLSQYNLNRFLFSPEFENLHTVMMGDPQSAAARRTVMLYKLWTLKYRHHWYFERLLPELNHYQVFREYWQSPSLHDEDIYIEYNHITLKHPGLGLLRFLACPTHAITTAGDLNLFGLQPLDAHTAEACLLLARKNGTQLIPLAPWPKPPAPTGVHNSFY
ncbi:MAG: helix-turn-helix domain-containing protein [Anaerolineales bacterium]